MKKLLLLITALLMVVCSFAQTQNGHIFYQDEGNTYSYGRNVLFRTDHTNLDTLTDVVTGTIAFDTVNEVVVFYDGGIWKDLASDTLSIWETSGNYIYPDTIGDSLGIGTNSPTGILTVVDDDSTKVIVGDADLNVNGSPTTTNGFSATRYGDGSFVHVISSGRGSIYESFIASIDTSTGFTNSINTDTLGAEMVSGLSGSSKYNRFKVDTTDGAFIELPFADTDFYVKNASSKKVIEYDQSDAEFTISPNVRINGDLQSASLFSDATNSRVGIGTTSPTSKFVVQGESLLEDTDSTKLTVGESSLNVGGMDITNTGFNVTRYTSSSRVLSIYSVLSSASGYQASVASIDTVTGDRNALLVNSNEVSLNSGTIGGSENFLSVGQSGAILRLPISSSGLLIDNGASSFMRIDSDGNTGIGIDTPDTTLHVVGQFKYVDGNQSAGAKLISDASGNASWELPSFGEMGFGDSTTTIALTQNTPAWVTNANNDLWSFGATDFSNGVSYSGDSLLIATAGVYQVNIQLSMTGSTGSTIELQLFKNGSQDCPCSSILSLHNNETFSLSYNDITDLADGDFLRVFVENTGSSNDVDVLNGKITLHRLK